VIDLGPEGGNRGGEVVATGSPMELAERGGTPTADALRELLLGVVREAEPAAAAPTRRRGPGPAATDRAGGAAARRTRRARG
ncbi:MAG: hypothetical protein ACKOCT_03950, partial [Alphaproteobacteria bacterium]